MKQAIYVHINITDHDHVQFMHDTTDVMDRLAGLILEEESKLFKMFLAECREIEFMFSILKRPVSRLRVHSHRGGTHMDIYQVVLRRKVDS